MKQLSPKHILISRTDNIGDVILTLPLATLLKKNYPHCKITFLARNYVKAIVNSCHSVDEFLSWDTLNQLPQEKAIHTLQQLDVDTFVHVYPNAKIAKLAKKAKIKNRVGTAGRWYHYFTCTHRVNFSRSKSNLHEAQLNLKLLFAFNLRTNYTVGEITPLINLQCNNTPAEIHAFLNPHKFNLIVHPLTNGNTREWPLENFCKLINALSPEHFNVLVTGSPKESAQLKHSLLTKCPNATDVTGKLSLQNFLALIQHSDGLLANSTGPLHLAAALGIKTLGLFPPAPTMNPKRWAPLGKHASYLVTDRRCEAKHCNNSSNCACIQAISVQSVQQRLTHWQKLKERQSQPEKSSQSL